MELSGYCQPKCLGHERWMKNDRVKGEDRDWKLSFEPSAGHEENVYVCNVLRPYSAIYRK